MPTTPVIRRGKVATQRHCIECGKDFSTINPATTRCRACLKNRRTQFEARKSDGLYPPRPCLLCGAPYVSSAIRVLCCESCQARRVAEPAIEELFQKRAKARREAHATSSAQLVFAYAELHRTQEGRCPICAQTPEQQMVLYPSDQEPKALLCQPCATAAAALAHDAKRARRLLSLLLVGYVVEGS